MSLPLLATGAAVIALSVMIVVWFISVRLTNAGIVDIAWSAKKKEGDDENAAVVTSGKTLKLSNSPWAHRGEPLEIDNLIGDDTRDELLSFLDHVRRADPATICDAREGLRDTATVLAANQSIDEGRPIDVAQG